MAENSYKVHVIKNQVVTHALVTWVAEVSGCPGGLSAESASNLWSKPVVGCVAEGPPNRVKEV